MSGDKDIHESETRKNPPSERVGDITDQPADVEALNREKAADLANVLEDLKFPATKEEIRNYVNAKPPSGSKKADIMQCVDSLQDNTAYNNVHEIEKDAGLVRRTG